MPRLWQAAVAVSAILGLAIFLGLASPQRDGRGQDSRLEYVVKYKAGVSAAGAERAVRALGGHVVATRPALRIMLVRSRATGFASSTFRSPALVGATRNAIIARATTGPDALEKENRGKGGG